MQHRPRRPARTWLAPVLAVGLSLALVACSEADGETDSPGPSPTTSTIALDDSITVGMYGTPEELDAYRDVVDSFNGSASGHDAELVTWPDRETAAQELLDGDVPDVFLAGRGDLRGLLDRDLIQPVSLLLDERGVDFGDRFSRDAVDSFAVDDDLQCMAYSISPMVMYYNTDLVELERMERRGLDVPSSAERWSLEEFTEAARFVARRHPEAAAVHIDPTLRGLAPFIYSGGGSLYDDEDEPTSLSFSDEATREALATTLPVLRDSTFTLTQRQLARQDPVEWFTSGRLAMMAGFRDLVPGLRETQGLDFDVISMPVLDSAETIGDVRGLCLSADSANVDDAADFITYAISDVAVERVVRAGSVVPSNTSVAGSDVFLAPGRQPLNSQVFSTAQRGLVIPPLLEDFVPLEEAVDPLLEQLLRRPGTLDLERAARQIDAASVPVLARQGVAGEDEDEDEDEE